MQLLENSDIVCVVFYTSTNQDVKITDYTFNFATIVYSEQLRKFKNGKKKKVLFDTEKGNVVEVRIYMRYDMARQFLSRLGYSYFIEDHAEGCKEICYREHWQSIYPKKQCSEFEFFFIDSFKKTNS